MVEPLNLHDLTLAIATVALELILLFYLIRRKLYRSCPAFFIYVLLVMLQSFLWESARWHWGTESRQQWAIYWAAQGVVIVARWFAVVEIARKALADYRGIWGLAGRILIVLSFCVLFYSLAFSQFYWAYMVLNADRALELCLATFIVGMFLFARYYQLPMLNMERQLAIGFCLYSCSWVINDSILENRQGFIWDFLNYVNSLAFIASLSLWIGAARQPVEVREQAEQTVLSPDAYAVLSQRLNSRLRILNDRLDHLFHSEDTRS